MWTEMLFRCGGFLLAPTQPTACLRDHKGSLRGAKFQSYGLHSLRAWEFVQTLPTLLVARGFGNSDSETSLIRRLGFENSDSDTRPTDSETQIRKLGFGNSDSETRPTDSETRIRKLGVGNLDSETRIRSSTLEYRVVLEKHFVVESSTGVALCSTEGCCTWTWIIEHMGCKGGEILIKGM